MASPATLLMAAYAIRQYAKLGERNGMDMSELRVYADEIDPRPQMPEDPAVAAEAARQRTLEVNRRRQQRFQDRKNGLDVPLRPRGRRAVDWAAFDADRQNSLTG